MILRKKKTKIRKKRIWMRFMIRSLGRIWIFRWRLKKLLGVIWIGAFDEDVSINWAGCNQAVEYYPRVS
jgi:hypothetical protein